MKRTVLILATLAVLTLGTVSYAGLDKRLATAPSTQATAHVLSKYEVGPPDARELLELVNAERARVGVAPLVIDEGLNTSAQIKADDMDNNDYFGHVDANGKHGYEYAYEYSASCKVPSENIRWTPLAASTSQVVYDGWYNSPQHIAAIRKADYTLTGIAVSNSADKYYTVQHFCIAK